MTQRDIFTDISNNYFQFTNSEKKVADCVLTHQQEAQLMSISELAEECGVAEATISRFCRKLNYSSYNAFKLAIAISTTSSLNSVQEIYPSGEIKQDDSLTDIAKKILTTDIAALNQTLDLIKSPNYIKAADLLIEADKVYCIGQGGSMFMAEEAWNLFSTSFPNYFYVQDSHLQTLKISLTSEKDVILIYSYSGSTKDIVDILQLAKERQTKVILVTHYPKSPGAILADVVIQCGSNESPLQIGSVVAKMAQLFVTDIIFNEVCRRNPELVERNREQTAKSLAQKHL